MIERTENGTFKLYLLSQSKLADDTKDFNLKKIGADKKVTYQWLLNPANKTEKLLKVSKKQLIGETPQEQEHELANITRESEMLRISGIKATQSAKFKGKNGKWSIRTSEDAAKADLYDFNTPKIEDELLSQDKEYNDTKNKDSVYMRLIGDMIDNMAKIHAAGKIHRDIKGKNILIYNHEQGLLRSKISDFGLAIAKEEQTSYKDINANLKNLIEKLSEQLANNAISEDEKDQQIDNLGNLLYSRTQPTGTCCYVSPQVVGFYIARKILDQPHTFESLHGDILSYACLGYELHMNSVTKNFNLLDEVNSDIDKANEMRNEIEVMEESKLITDEYYKLKEEHRVLLEPIDKLYKEVNYLANQKDDIFSLGVTIFIFVTKHYPTFDEAKTSKEAKGFHGMQYLNVKKAFEDYPLLKKIQPLLERMLEIDDDKRISAEEAKDLLEEIHRNNLNRLKM